MIARTPLVLPGSIGIVALSTAYALFQDAPWLTILFFGLKAAVLAVVVQALSRIGKRALKTSMMAGIAALAFLAIYALPVQFPVVVLAARLVGFVGVRFLPDQFPAAGHGGVETGVADGVVDHQLVAVNPSKPRAVLPLICWGALWAAPVIALVIALGFRTVFYRSRPSPPRWP